MRYFTIKPALGLKNNVAHNDYSLLTRVSDTMALCHCVDMQNIDFQRTRNACAKSAGNLVWSNSANAQHTKCMALFELAGISTTDNLYFDNGKVYYYDGSRDPINIDAATPVTFANDDLDLYSVIQYGDYMVFADHAEHTPYKWKNGDANLTKLILSGTEYKFRYLENFQRRIIGAYSDQTNGDLEIRWTDALPTMASLDFDPANQQYKTGVDSIAGIKILGRDQCFLYGENSIDAINYQPYYDVPFYISNMLSGQGSVNHHSIINIGSHHLLFNKHYGFCAYAGGSEFPAGGRPFSEPIEDIIATINKSYYSAIVGKLLPQTSEAVWAVPLDGASSNNALLFYHLLDGTWRKVTFSARWVDNWTIYNPLTWTSLVALGFSTWEELGNSRWADYVVAHESLVFGNTDGHLYYQGGESDNGSNFSGYRVEPILDLSFDNRHTLLKEIWFDLSEVGNYSIHCYYRGGNTVGECKAATWNSLDDLSVNNPYSAVIYLSQNNKYHQIKWGTDGANEPFVVNAIIFGFEIGSAY